MIDTAKHRSSRLNPRKKQTQSSRQKTIRAASYILIKQSHSTSSTATHVGIQLDTSIKTKDRTLKACRTLRASTASVIRCCIHPASINFATIMRKYATQNSYGCEIWCKLSKTETLMSEYASLCMQFHSRKYTH